MYIRSLCGSGYAVRKSMPTSFMSVCWKTQCIVYHGHVELCVRRTVGILYPFSITSCCPSYILVLGGNPASCTST